VGGCEAMQPCIIFSLSLSFYEGLVIGDLALDMVRI
jgi:hypothetical protein